MTIHTDKLTHRQLMYLLMIHDQEGKYFEGGDLIPHEVIQLEAFGLVRRGEKNDIGYQQWFLTDAGRQKLLDISNAL